MSSPQHEPTMEEILASIRKIISEDNPEAAPAPEAPAASPAPEIAKQELPSAPAPAAVSEIEVLELTQEMVEPTAQPEPVAMAQPPKADDIVFEPARPAAAADEGIFSEQTRKAMDDAFASLDEPREPEPAPRHSAPSIAPVSGSSVESVFERAVRESFEPVLAQYLSDNFSAVIERMKPLIREWMDEHFPALLEGAVRNEIERVVRARGRH